MDPNVDTSLFENADDRAHFAFYDPRNLVSYVWGGGEDIQVSFGGYGELPTKFFRVPLTWNRANVTLDIFETFVRGSLVPAIQEEME